MARPFEFPLESIAGKGIVDGDPPASVRLAAQHVGEARGALERRAVGAAAGERKRPQHQHQIVGAREALRIDAQAAAHGDLALQGGAELRRARGDAARLEDEDGLGVVEREQRLEIAGVVGRAERRVEVFGSRRHRSEHSTARACFFPLPACWFVSFFPLPWGERVVRACVSKREPGEGDG